jgi:hypothetical protein
MAPVRLPTETKDISGQKLNLDLGFLKAGSSTREEVGKNLAAIDTQVNQPHFFWGRWETSSWAVAGLVAQMGPAAAPYGERFWGGHNLLIEFDPQGIVKSWRVVDDKKLFPELDRLGAAPSDPVFPVNAKVHVPFSREDPMDHKPASATAELVLAADSLECRSPQISRERMRTFSCQSLRTPRTNISKIEPAHLEESDSSVWVTVHFAKSVRDGHGWKNSYLYIGVDPPTLLLLRRYVHDTKLAAGK